MGKQAVYKTSKKIDDFIMRLKGDTGRVDLILRPYFHLYFRMKPPDEDADTYHLMLYPKLIDGVSIQVAPTGTLSINFQDFEQLWLVEKYINNAFIESGDSPPLLWPEKIHELGSKPIVYVSEEKVEKMDFFLRTLESDLPERINIIVPDDSGYGYTSKEISRSEYNKLNDVRRRILKTLGERKVNTNE